VVLLGLGKVGTRVLAKLTELDIPVVCVEENPEARGISLARRLRVPVVLGDVTQARSSPSPPGNRTPAA
jgi:Trk K+ transport system NAD-binding subunit